MTSNFFWSSPCTFVSPTAVPLKHETLHSNLQSQQVNWTHSFAKPALRTAVDIALMAVSRELRRRVRLPVAPCIFLCSFSTNLVRVIVSTSSSSWARIGPLCKAAMIKLDYSDINRQGLPLNLFQGAKKLAHFLPSRGLINCLPSYTYTHFRLLGALAAPNPRETIERSSSFTDWTSTLEVVATWTDCSNGEY